MAHHNDSTDKETIAQMTVINAELMEAMRGFANIGEYRELREAMANCLRPHERAGFIECFNKARAAYAKAEAFLRGVDKIEPPELSARIMG